MAIKFNSLYKHGTREFLPGVSLSFPPEVEKFFCAALAAETTTDPAVHTYAEGDVEIDPETRRNSDGLLVADVIAEADAGIGPTE
jgi:hypothetical protein